MFNAEIYISRRKRLQSYMKSGLIIIPGNSDSPVNYPSNTYRFRQDSTFLYFFGIDKPGLAAIIDVDNDNHLIFGNDPTPGDILWGGPSLPLSVLASNAGVFSTLPFKQIFEVVATALGKGQQIHFIPPYRAETKLFLAELLQVNPGNVAAISSGALVNACVKLRSVKEDAEIVEMDACMGIASEMQVTAMRMCQPGTSEQQIAAAIERIPAALGLMLSFPVICTTRGEILHNHRHDNLLKKGNLLLVDAGCESLYHYATDHTRVMPVGGEFDSRQKDIYDIVLMANDAARGIIKPGIPFREVHLHGSRIIATGLKDLGLMRGNVDEAVEKGAHALFFPHGIGHMIGLDVHDMENYSEDLVGYDHTVQRSKQFGLSALRLGRSLQAGFTVTIEPGIYFIPSLIASWKNNRKHENFINYDALEGYADFGGIRLEDVVVVTPGGARILGNRIPVTTNEVEQEVKLGSN